MRQLALFAILLAVCASAHAGVVYEIEVNDHDGSGQPESTEVMVEGKNLAMTINPGQSETGKGKMIYRGDRGENGEVVVVDDDDKSYYVIDDETVAAIGGQVADAMRQMDEMMKNLPKEQQDAIKRAREQGLGMPGMPAEGRGPSKPELRKTGERATKRGYPCVKYEVWRDGRKIRELWITDWSNVEGGGEARDAFRNLAGFFDAMLEALPELPGGGGPIGGGFTDEMGFSEGFPVENTGFGPDGEEDDFSGLRSARRRTLDPAEFEPPSGYKRRSMGPQ